MRWCASAAPPPAPAKHHRYDGELRVGGAGAATRPPSPPTHLYNGLSQLRVGEGEEGVRGAARARPPRPPNAVHVVLRGLGHVKVDHALDALHVYGWWWW